MYNATGGAKIFRVRKRQDADMLLPAGLQNAVSLSKIPLLKHLRLVGGDAGDRLILPRRGKIGVLRVAVVFDERGPGAGIGKAHAG